MTFEEILPLIKRGNSVHRTGWNGKHQFISMHYPSSRETVTIPYLLIFTESKDWIPWIPTQSDILAIDWELVPLVDF